MMIDMDVLKREAAGRWPQILSVLGGVPSEILDGKHHPCPRCGGKDRFRLIDRDSGALYCNQCFNRENGDGIAALEWLRAWDFPRTILELTDYLHISPVAPRSAQKPDIVATYDYRDEDGVLLYQVVKFDPKDFRQRRPMAGGGWEWTIKGTRLIPYRLRELLAADATHDVWIVEGEKDADRAASIGIVATTGAMGAGKWRHEYNDYFRGRSVCIIPDNDQTGREHANQVAESLSTVASRIKIVELAGVPDKGDLSDWLDGGHTVEELCALGDTAPDWQPPVDKKQGGAGAKTKKMKKRVPSQATALVELVEKQGAQLWHTPEGVGFITVPVGGHTENWTLRSNGFKRWVQREYFGKARAAVNAQAIQDAVGVLEGKALFDGQQYEAYIRVAEYQGSIFVDLADPEWRVVEINDRGYQVLSSSPVKFRRCKAMQTLPEPEPGHIAELRQQLCLYDESWPLAAGWMLGALRQRGPFPVLNLNAEQGAGKTTTARKIRALIDPNTAPVRCEPKEPRDLMIAASNGWIIALDNLSHIPSWLSDALCRLSTGGGFSTRELYSDSEEVIFDAKRPIIITGIEELATRGDLLDRSLMVTLPNIPEERRRPESEIWREFDEAQPRLLGALYETASVALRQLPTTKVDRLPRMADFALWSTSAESAIGLRAGEFMQAYAGNRAAGHELALESTPLGKVLPDFVERNQEWTGTASDLLTELDVFVDEKTKRLKGWPQTGRSLSGVLKRLAPNLRAVGVDVESGRTKKGRFISLRKPASLSVTNVTHVIPPTNHGCFDGLGDEEVTQTPGQVTQEDTRDAAEDAGDDEFPWSSGRREPFFRPEEDLSVCPHDDVEETPTFDRYLNRQCRVCGAWLRCRRAT